MKKSIFYIVICLVTSINVFSQSGKWVKYIGFSNKDVYGYDLTQYYDKGYIISGGVIYPGNKNGITIKSDINANILWEQEINYPQSEYYKERAIAYDDSGNFYIIGTLWAELFIGKYWPVIIKFNACGEKQWCKILKDEIHDRGSGVDIAINQDGEIIILALLSLNEFTDKVYLFGLDENGNVLWKNGYARLIDYPWIRYPIPFKLLNLGSQYYIAGSCYWPYPDDTTHWYLRPMFIGVDSLFNEKWMIPFYALDSIFGEAYNITSLNDSVIVGIGDRWLDNNSKNSIFMYFNGQGQELGYTQIPNSDFGPDIIANVTRGLVKVNDSLLMSLSVWSDTPEGKLGFFTFDTAGNLYNIHQDIYCDFAQDLIKTYQGYYVAMADITNPDANIYLTEFDKNLQPVPFDTNTYTYDSLCSGGIQSGTIDLSDCFVWTGTEEIPSPEEYYSFIATIPITAYPNPAETEITLAFENTDHHNNMLLECYNIYGQRVHSEKIWKGQQNTKINVSGLAKGLYLAVVKSEGKVAGSAKFVVR